MSVVARPPRLADRTPADWRDLLLDQLEIQAAAAELYDSYYNGDHPLQFATSKFREAFGNLFAAFADNWCQIVVDASVERLQVIGFQVGGAPSDDAWAIWQRNALDVESVIAHTEAGKCGRCFLLVDPNGGEPLITVEHASQVVVVTDPANRRRRLAALKHWIGDDAFEYATLYLPDVVLRYQSEEPIPDGGVYRVEWVPRDDGGSLVENTLGVVPAIPLDNKPGLLPPLRPSAWRTSTAHSDLEPAIPIQNAVNKLCSDMLVASEYGSFRQRAVTGVDVPKDPVTGKVSQEVEASLSRVWAFKPADARIWDMAATELGNFVTAINLFIQHLAAQTRTPPHYLLGQVINASGDALSVAEAGLVAKCRTKVQFFSDPWEEAIALALTAAGSPTEHASCEALWANPERQTQAQLTDAATKKKALGVPLEVIWAELGYTPEQIQRMTELETSAAEQTLEAAATPPAPGPTPPPTPPPPIPPTGGTDG